ncbi:hydrogenase nickel incorporation protein HypB [Vibrio sp. HN007]|uniref:hydrogenase nickel incorporation protein HypB n=1 Tax=Vibrio iocasae TaxID=3098914 RepID=UPI0035D4A14E
MCTTCGCAAGNVKIEGGHSHDHDHSHEHSHDHHHHDHSHQAQIVHHHHYHGPVHIHYHVNGQEPHSHDHPHHHEPHHHDHGHSHDHHHHSHDDHTHDHHHEAFKPEKDGDDLHYGQGPAHSHAPGMTQSRMVQIEQDILAKNDEIAEKNRSFLANRQIKSLNMVSSPGSGKTTLLTETLKKLDHTKCAVIEGDQQTTNDADRIRETGAKAIQVNTGKGCHLDAAMVSEAIANLAPETGTTLFIENVGNLVCPAAFDLGETHKVAIISVTEGADKPLKYPDIFANAELMVVNKIDLLPYVNFDVEACIQNAQRVNPNIKHMTLSATTGEGMQSWLDWLEAR